MRIGCGLRVHRIDGNEYLYFWHYERENGRSRRREDYVGPARDPASRQNGGGGGLPHQSRDPNHVPARGGRPRRSPRAARAGPVPPPPPPSTAGGASGGAPPAGP